MTRNVDTADVLEVKEDESLRGRVARGLAYNVFFSILSKLVGLVVQVSLAWFLVPEDYGQVAFASIFIAFAGLIRESGIGQVVVKHWGEIEYHTSSVIWLSLLLGIVASLVLIGVGAVSMGFGQSDDLPQLLFLAALFSPIQALSVVPQGALQAKLKFDLLARINMMLLLIASLGSIAMAALSCGAYSIILPNLAIAIPKAIILFRYASIHFPLTPSTKNWSVLIRESAWIVVASFAATVCAQADYFFLGMYQSRAELGIYFFGFGLSMQVVGLLTANLSSVLFPALSLLQNDRKRQGEAFMRSAKVLAFVAIPPLVLQSVLAGPIIRFFFNERMTPAIPILAVLSFASIFCVLAGPCVTAFIAQGRHKGLVAMNYSIAAAFSLVVLVAARESIIAVAISEVLFFACTGLLGSWLTVRYWGISASEVFYTFAKPIFVGVVCCLPHAALMGAAPHWDGIRLFLGVLTLGPMMYFATRWVDFQSFDHIRHELIRLLSRVRPSWALKNRS